MPQGHDLNGIVFNCLAVISEILMRDAVARVMKKLKYTGPHTFWDPERFYLFNIY